MSAAERSHQHTVWIVGHLAWSRTMVLSRLGRKWTLPWMRLYARGDEMRGIAGCSVAEGGDGGVG